MKVHLVPQTILLWRPSLIEAGVEALLSSYGLRLNDWQQGDDRDGDQIPEVYGRLCYASFGPRQGRVGAFSYHANILESKHGSVLETATWGFVVAGASRGYLAQMTRHRAGFAYAAESTHFIRYSDHKTGSLEPGIGCAGIPAEQLPQYVSACQDALERYDQLWEDLRQNFPADAKVKKIVSGAARGLLPTALECRLGFTANARALRHFVEMRGNPSNTLEIRLVAVQVAQIMLREAPAIFQDVDVYEDEDGEQSVSVRYSKV